jgi:hypothetical protein
MSEINKTECPVIIFIVSEMNRIGYLVIILVMSEMNKRECLIIILIVSEINKIECLAILIMSEINNSVKYCRYVCMYVCMYIASMIYIKIRKFSSHKGKEIDFVYTITENTSNFDNTWLSQLNHDSGKHSTAVTHSALQQLSGRVWLAALLACPITCSLHRPITATYCSLLINYDVADKSVG